jgi:hypothetical protein
MRSHSFVLSTLTLICAFVLSGCSQDSVVTTPTASLDPLVASSQAQPAPGSFICVLTFFIGPVSARQFVSSLPVGEGMNFDAYVTDSSGSPATAGLVVLEACMLQGKHAPSDACVTGHGQWQRLRFGRGIEVVSAGPLAGHVFAEGETSNVPATRGYRFEFFLQGSGGIPDGVGAPTDFSWF